MIELVLNGVGGSTIAEAERTITPQELEMWGVYRNKYGTFNVSRKIEQIAGFGNWLFASVNSAKGKNPSISDFMPHEHGGDDNQSQSNNNEHDLEQKLFRMSKGG